MRTHALVGHLLFGDFVLQMNDQSNTIQPMLNVTAAVTGELIASVQLAEFERRPVKSLEAVLGTEDRLWAVSTALVEPRSQRTF